MGHNEGFSSQDIPQKDLDPFNLRNMISVRNFTVLVGAALREIGFIKMMSIVKVICASLCMVTSTAIHGLNENP